MAGDVDIHLVAVGAAGPAGATGADGAAGPAGSPGNGIRFNNDISSNDVTVDPGVGNVRFDTSSFLLITEFSISIAEAVGGVDVTGWVADWKTGDVVLHRLRDDPGSFLFLKLTADPVLQAGNQWYRVQATPISFGGSYAAGSLPFFVSRESQTSSGGGTPDLYAENPTTFNAPVASGANAVAIGSDAVSAGSDSLAIGSGAVTSSNPAEVAIGPNAVTDNGSSLAIGFGANALFNRASAISTDAIAGADEATAFGFSADATGSRSVALGVDAQATNTDAVAIGEAASASGTQAVAVGSDANAQQEGAIAVGDGASANGLFGGNYPVAVGRNASATRRAVAVGGGATAPDEGVAVGQNANAGSAQGTALGRSATATGSTATALGFNVQATGDGGITIGANSTNSKAGTTVLGGSLTARYDNAHLWGGVDSLSGTFWMYLTEVLLTALSDGDVASGVATLLTVNNTRITVPSGHVMPFEAMVFAEEVGASGTNHAAYRVTGGVIVNNGGTTTMVAAPTVTELVDTITGGASLTVTADDTNDALQFQATTATATAGVRWVAWVKLIDYDR